MIIQLYVKTQKPLCHNGAIVFLYLHFSTHRLSDRGLADLIGFIKDLPM